ncbi:MULTISPECIES: phosphatidate cytidylyltransferase [Butyrivibrio]|uniref:Phosphatidate cytidylyltransferase n=1 Tax=Butyrivibrio fibrisolvens TaxID=831 RepID=A0A1H9WAN8_BUTFI|nr:MULTISPECIES: phosphatidate cytidylyltransferase [Butyrivibrio]MBQ1458416.1 phosphatidate cytidylyltransferase [Butyrivibrio sp.]MCR4635671.1 phosphatidate cytidylyltransferase [Butyrivibrio sp.]SEQ42044.1 phosphatidate cytidylyltransferase [Butyrivibrio sp. TB]SES30533.1 phosphatidate cytidylyltransferase [Butyrivibrio fibrisolvens]
MKTRVISSIVIGIILAITLVLGGYVLGGASLIVAQIAYYEIARVLGVFDEDGKTGLLYKVGFVGVLLHYILVIYIHDTKTYLLSVLFVFFAVMVTYVLTFPRYKVHQVIGAVFAFLYAPLMLSFIYLLRIRENGEFLVWMPFVAWVCDSFAYLTGRAFGKHKMTPVLSPHKTIEGGIGGVFFSIVAGVIFGFVMMKVKGVDAGIIPQFMVITLVAGFISQLGDLAASAIKRDRDIKDYGRLIPGHGGIMDRFDSVIFVTPFIYGLVVFIMK